MKRAKAGSSLCISAGVSEKRSSDLEKLSFLCGSHHYGYLGLERQLHSHARTDMDDGRCG